MKILKVMVLCLFISFFILGESEQEKKSKIKSAAAVLEQEIMKKGIQSARKKFELLRKDKSGKYEIKEHEFNYLGYKLRYRGKIEEAFEVFKWNTEIFPQSDNAWDSLGGGYVYLGKKDEAIKCYRKALELNPKNEYPKWNIKRIDNEIYSAVNETKKTNKYRPGEQTKIDKPFFGQIPPGLKPVVFAPGIVSTRGGHEFSITFSPDMKAIYFNRGPNIWMSYWGKQGWSAPIFTRFNHQGLDHEAHITADGKRLYFGSSRPREAVKPQQYYGIYVLEKTEKGWGKPQYFCPGMYVTTSKNGNIYLTDTSKGYQNAGIVWASLINGKAGEFEFLGGGVNSKYTDAHPCIAPDESFIIFDSARPYPGGKEGGEALFVCFKQKDGSWSEAQALKELNTLGGNMTVSLSPDGKYLFYYANHDIYWVSIKILDRYRLR